MGGGQAVLGVPPLHDHTTRRKTLMHDLPVVGNQAPEMNAATSLTSIEPPSSNRGLLFASSTASSIVSYLTIMYPLTNWPSSQRGPSDTDLSGPIHLANEGESVFPLSASLCPETIPANQDFPPRRYCFFSSKKPVSVQGRISFRQILPGRFPGEFLELPDKMRLVEIAKAVQDFRPSPSVFFVESLPNFIVAPYAQERPRGGPVVLSGQPLEGTYGKSEA